MERKRWQIITSITINSIIIALELFSLAEVFFRFLPGTEPFKWYHSLTYYTNLGNTILMVGCILCLINDIRELKGLNTFRLFTVFKFTGVIAGLVIFITIYIIIILTGDLVYGFSVLGNSWLFLHTLCPIIGCLSFILFDTKQEIKKLDVIYPLLFTFLYTTMVAIINFAGGRVPYVSDLEEPTKVSFWFILGLGLGEMAITTGSAFLVRFIRKKVNARI